EPPTETVRRELKEELGLDLHPGQLLCIDWVSPHGPWDDSLMFIFDGGILNEHQIADLSLHDNELRGFKFCTEEEAAKRLRPYIWRRTHAALDALRAGTTPYLQDGHL
ncbi:NUDIX hydrolase, partial [Spirillospora sp. NPDC000708]